MEVIPLGAGQEVGKSCIVVTIHDKTIMFDCGMHIGYNDSRKFPDFTYLSKTGNFDAIVDCIIISHFHLDHCGALPYFTEVCGYSGPIYMTHPTKATLPIVLEDYRKILSMKNKDNKTFTSEQIDQCIKKVIPLHMNETFTQDNGLEITPYYAGHVIGAAMYYVRYKGKSVVYTGDFSTTADKHLGSAWIDCVHPDLLITESTYGSVVRDCRKAKEREFLQIIQLVIDRGGQVLIPIFTFGRFQEICMMVESYWERMGLTTPIYFAGGMVEKANEIYRRFINYTNQTVQNKIHERNVFEFKYTKAYNKKTINPSEPGVFFATPSMLHSGMSLKLFKGMCSDAKNAVILAGYCIPGTIGEKILNGINKLEILGDMVEVNLGIYNISFSAHADSFGILKIIDQCKPKNIMLVHGDKSRMNALKKIIRADSSINVFTPPNGVLVWIPTSNMVNVRADREMLEKHVRMNEDAQDACLALRLKNDDGQIVALECKKCIRPADATDLQ